MKLPRPGDVLLWESGVVDLVLGVGDLRGLQLEMRLLCLCNPCAAEDEGRLIEFPWTVRSGRGCEVLR